MRFIIFLLLLILKGAQASGSTSFIIGVGDTNINAITNYTWSFVFTDLSSRSWMLLTFPTSVTITANSVSYVGSTLIGSFGFTSNSLNLSTSTLPITNILNIIVFNVTNPYSAQRSVTSFYYRSDSDASITLDLLKSINYDSGVLNSCTWSFNQCTEQTNSQLAITLKTVNHIPIGSSQISVGFPAVWANQNQKSLLYGASSNTLPCAISFNGGANLTSGVTCIASPSLYTITISYSVTTALNGNDTIVLYIQGLMSPPTVTTPSNTLYTAQTADPLGNIIDGISTGSSCSISPTCVTNFTNAIFTPSTLPLNTLTTNIEAVFNDYPTISFLAGDSIVVTYSEPTKLTNCATFKVLRNGKVYVLVNNSTSSVMTYYFPPDSNLPNNDYGFSITLYMVCTSIQMPPSETPVNYLFTFIRNGAEYMQLSGTFTATATVLNAVNASLTLSNYQMGSTATTYLFSFTNGQPLSSSPSFVLAFPSDISLSGVTCSIGVNGALSPIACNANSSNLIINYAGAAISSGSAISIQVSGITNPILPMNYTFGLTTYYNSSISTSRVEYNSAAFTAIYTAITNLPVTLTPSTFTVYTFTSINISFTCPLNIPALSTFTLVFPSDITQLTPPTQPLIVNNSSVLLTSSPSTFGSTVAFSNMNAISMNSSIIITLSLRTPTYISTFPSIQLSVTQNNNTYLQSLSNMLVQVTVPGVMPVAITPYYSLTGASSPYLITLTLSIPHPGVFTVEVSVGNDAKFISGGASCTSVCSGISPVGLNGFSVTVNNPYANSTSPVNIDLNISTFTNSRNIGPGLLWNITTKTISTDEISFQSSFPTISTPNLLSGALKSTQSYYRNNTSTVKFQLNLTNLLQTSDYLLFTMDRTTYNAASSINCTSVYGTCSIQNSSTVNVLVIRVIPNSNNILSNPLELWIEGLTSGANTYYLQTDLISVGSYNTNGNLIDQGKIPYNISCRDSLTLPNNCRTCLNGQCIDCYTTQGYFLNGTTCVTSCGSASNYLSFANNSTGTCQSCASAATGCMTCINSTACLTCFNSSYYLFPTLLTCNLICPNTSGFINTFIGTIQVCVQCADSNCLICTTTSYGTCTKCVSTSILISGICSSSCPSPSFYVSNYNCVQCDASCYTCTGAGSNACIQCSIGYYNLSGVCLSSCPNGTAIILSNGTCGCASTCLTCDSSSYIKCTACSNSSLFVYNGDCVSVCPSSTYQASSTTCLACSTGCMSCTSALCLACDTNWYIYANKCYSDCNLISLQYDSFGLTCILCPTGCDTCFNGACTSCLADYTLMTASSSCIKTCELTSSCAVDTGNVMPLPGCISLFIWGGVVLIVHLFSHKNYIPYSLILFSSMVQFILMIVVISESNSIASARLLTYLDAKQKNIIIGLLAFSLGINYISNFIYLYLFVKYIKPLINNPKQIDVISHVVILIIAMLTNYRFAMIAFAKMFPKPSIHIEMQKNLTPVHYLCLATIILSIFPIIGAGVGLTKQQKLTTPFMLSLDLIIIIIFNIIITLWFVSSKKDDSYFDEEQKKEYTSENLDINVTKQNINKGEKDASDVNMIVSMHEQEDKNSQQSDQYDFGQSFKKFKAKKAKITNRKDNTILIKNQAQQNMPKQSNQKDYRNHQIFIESNKKSPERNIFAIENQYQQQLQKVEDINFQERIQKRGTRISNSNNRLSRATTVNKNRFQLEHQNAQKSLELDEQVFDKQLNFKNQAPQQNQQQSDLSSIDDANEQSLHQMESHLSSINLDTKDKITKRQRNFTNHDINPKKQMIKSYENKTAMRKDKTQRYMEADAATEYKKDKQDISDIASIIKFKVQESSIRKSQNITMLSNQENDLEEISPSYYNVQNQRFYIEDIEGSQSNQS